METALKDKKIAVLVADDFEQGEFTEARRALEEAGAETALIAPAGPMVQGRHFDKPGDEFPVDGLLEEVDPDDYDGLLLPGGTTSLSNLRLDDRAGQFPAAFLAAGKPVAAVSRAPWLLIEAGVLEGRRLTSAESIRTDVRNAGGEWVDERVVVDKGLVTCGKPGDLFLLNQKFIEQLGRKEEVQR